MDKLKSLKNMVPPILLSKYVFLIIIVVAIFLALSVYIYKKYIKTKLNPTYVANREYTTGDSDSDNETVDLYFFYTNWCPHCKKALPVWKQFKEQLKGQKVNGKKVNFIDVDCEKDTTTADKFNVKGYPTIKLVNNNQIIEYDAKPDVDTLTEFINTSTK